MWGTLASKVWCGCPTWLEAQLYTARDLLLTACPANHTSLPRRPGLNPVAWTLGHVAFTFDALVAYPLRLPTPGAICASPLLLRAEAAKLYDSMRVGGAERWAITEGGEMPDARPWLDQTHETCAALLRAAVADGEARMSAAVSYLILYAIIHEVCPCPAPAPSMPYTCLCQTHVYAPAPSMPYI